MRVRGASASAILHCAPMSQASTAALYATVSGSAGVLGSEWPGALGLEERGERTREE